MKSVFFYFLLPASSFLLIGVCVLFSAFFFPFSAHTPVEFSGIVADPTTSKTLGYVIIALENDKNEPIKTILTKQDGSFSFISIQQGKYTLYIVAMGYQGKQLSIDLSRDIDLGTIYINPKATTLNAVTVTPDKPVVKIFGRSDS